MVVEAVLILWSFLIDFSSQLFASSVSIFARIVVMGVFSSCVVSLIKLSRRRRLSLRGFKTSFTRKNEVIIVMVMTIMALIIRSFKMFIGFFFFSTTE